MNTVKCLVIAAALNYVSAQTSAQVAAASSASTIYNPLQGQSSSAVGSAIESTYGSSDRAYQVHQYVPDMFGPHNFDPNNTNAYIHSRAYLAIPPAGIAALVFLVGIIYMIVRACTRTPVAVEKVVEPYVTNGYSNTAVPINNTYGTSGIYNDRLNTLGEDGAGIRGTSWAMYLLSLFTVLCSAGFAGATLYYNQQAHNNAGTVEQYSTQIFSDSINFVNGVGQQFTQIASVTAQVAADIASYAYIGNDVDYYVSQFEAGRYPATIVIMALTLLCFVMLLITAPILCTRGAFARRPASPLLTITAILIWITAILSWLLLAVHLVVLKADGDICVYADGQEYNIESNALFNNPTISGVAATCLLDQNPLPAFSSSATGTTNCNFLAGDYLALKSSMCQTNGLIDSYSFITLFTFIIAVLLTLGAIFTEAIAQRARMIKVYLYNETPIAPLNQTTVVNNNTYATNANYIPETTEVYNESAPYENNAVEPAYTPTGRINNKYATGNNNVYSYA